MKNWWVVLRRQCDSTRLPHKPWLYAACLLPCLHVGFPAGALLPRHAHGIHDYCWPERWLHACFHLLGHTGMTSNGEAVRHAFLFCVIVCPSGLCQADRLTEYRDGPLRTPPVPVVMEVFLYREPLITRQKEPKRVLLKLMKKTTMNGQVLERNPY